MPTTTSTSQKIRLPVSKGGHRRLRATLLLGMFLEMFLATNGAASPAPPTVTCQLRVAKSVERGKPVVLTMALHNRSASPMAVLSWGTPFEEAWLQPFVDVQRDGRPIAYGGALVKRGDPEADEYVGLAPDQRRVAQLDMAEVFDFSVPGRYVIVPRMVLHDVVKRPALPPRPRERHEPMALHCPSAVVIVTR